MNFLDSTSVGSFTLAAGISALIQIILLILMFTVSRSPYGRMSDYFMCLPRCLSFLCS